MSRISREQMYMAFARTASLRGTCFRLNVGAVVVHARNVIGVGYNGAPSGEDHCGGQGCKYYQPSGCQVVHAEANALQRAEGAVDGACSVELYCTHSPCSACASIIRLSKSRLLTVEAVYFEVAYRDPAPIRFLLDSGIRVRQILPSGMVIDQLTGELLT